LACGRPVDAAASTDAEGAVWLQQRVADLAAEGWEPVADDGDRAVLRKRGVGRLPVHVALLFVIGGIGNALYALYRYTAGAPRRVVYADGTETRSGDGDGDGLATVLAAALAGALVVGGVGWVGAAVLANLSALTAAIAALAFVLAALVTVLIPQVARDRLRPIGTFGRERTVERERTRTTPEPCTACGRRVLRGERRRYAERLYVAGIPVGTIAAGANTYCGDCATAGAASSGHARESSRGAEGTAERGAEGTAERGAERAADRGERTPDDGDTEADRELDSTAR
jgi:hypothetical protein